MVLKLSLRFTPVKIGHIIVLGSGDEMHPGLAPVVAGSWEAAKSGAGRKIRIERHLTQTPHLLRATYHQVRHAGDDGGGLSGPPVVGPQSLGAFMELSV